jgi:hypothetical protein
MAEPILFMGKSGVGKSYALRTLDPKTTVIIKPNAKSISIYGASSNYSKANKNLLTTDKLSELKAFIKQIATSEAFSYVRTIVVEDFTHYFTSHIFSAKFLNRNSGNEAFQRWNEFGALVHSAIIRGCEVYRDNLDIVIIHHTDTKDDGTVGFKSSGKLLDGAIDIPSYFTYIFHGLTQIQKDGDIKYGVLTNKDSIRHAKTPPGLFPLYIPNDMKYMLDRIHDYKNGTVENFTVEDKSITI